MKAEQFIQITYSIQGKQIEKPFNNAARKHAFPLVTENLQRAIELGPTRSTDVVLVFTCRR